MKRLAGYTLVVMATLAALYLFWQLQAVVGVFVLSLFMTATLRPIVRRVRARGFPMGLALALTYGGLILITVLLLVGLSQPLMAEGVDLVNALGRAYETNYTRWEEGSGSGRLLASRLPPPPALYESLAADDGRLLAQGVLAAGQRLLTVLGVIILVLVLSLYWTLDQAHFERVWLSLVAPEHRALARDIWRKTEIGIGSYIRNEAAQAVIAFFFLWLGYELMDIRYPTILALVGALAWVIPVVGFIFTIIPAFLGGLTASLPIAILAVLYTSLILLVLELVVQPRLFRQRLYSPILAILLLVPLAETYGILGLLAAPPLAVAIQTLLGNLLRRRSIGVTDVYPTAQVKALHQQLGEVRIAAELEGTPELNNMVQRLEKLLREAEEALQKEPLPLPQGE